MTSEEKQTPDAQIISDLMLEHLHAIRLDVANMREDLSLIKARLSSLEARVASALHGAPSAPSTKGD
jgi:hypothetical protein